MCVFRGLYLGCFHGVREIEQDPWGAFLIMCMYVVSLIIVIDGNVNLWFPDTDILTSAKNLTERKKGIPGKSWNTTRWALHTTKNTNIYKIKKIRSSFSIGYKFLWFVWTESWDFLFDLKIISCCRGLTFWKKKTNSFKYNFSTKYLE